MTTLRPLHFIFFFLASLILTYAPLAAETASITDYRPIFRAGRDSSGQIRIAIREYKSNNVPYLLIVNPANLETSAVKASAFDFTGNISLDTLRNTSFVKTLDRYTALPCKLQNHGAAHAEYPVTGMFLTVDLCPSRRPFEKYFFTILGDLSRENGAGTPVAIAVTGMWMENHRDELAGIIQQIREGRLVVTWVDHSATHPFNPGIPLERNFLLSPDIDLEHEVSETEQLLLKNGLIPSPFFRFPGLVADGKLLQKLRELALIPVGSDAWLAKGEIPTSGSFILVHGNGNEPLGISKVLQLLHNPGEVKLLPLGDAFTACGK